MRMVEKRRQAFLFKLSQTIYLLHAHGMTSVCEFTKTPARPVNF